MSTMLSLSNVVMMSWQHRLSKTFFVLQIFWLILEIAQFNVLGVRKIMDLILLLIHNILIGSILTHGHLRYLRHLLLMGINWVVSHVILVHISFVRHKLTMRQILYLGLRLRLNKAILNVVNSSVAWMLLMSSHWLISKRRLHHKWLLVLLKLHNSLILTIRSRIVFIQMLSLWIVLLLLPAIIRSLVDLQILGHFESTTSILRSWRLRHILFWFRVDAPRHYFLEYIFNVNNICQISWILTFKLDGNSF